MARPISEYNKKRNFDVTSEPPEEKPRAKRAATALRFVIQKHDARVLHYDFRLEMNGTLKSWAIPKGPSLDPKDKRLAVHVEDHPISYAKFEGSIPKGQYGGGDVIVWDEGVWLPHGDMNASYKSGKLKFTLIGEKLTGDWALVKTRLPGKSDKEQWLLIKEKDEVAQPADEYNIVQMRPESVVTGDLLPMDQTAKKPDIKTKSAKKTPAKKTSTSVKKTPVKKATATSARKKKSPSATEKSVVIPDAFSPELATLVTEPPSGDWLYEIKFDGYRMLARVLAGKVNIFTRNGLNWTERLPLQVKAIEALKLHDSWLDGEMVVLNDAGLPSFQALQNAFDAKRTADIFYYLFDAPFLNGRDLRELPVEERRAEVEKIIPQDPENPLRFSAAFDADHRSIVQSACAMSLEGVIGKRAGSPYVSRRSDDWIKLKCRLRQEFVIIGYTEPQGSRSGFGALLLGVHSAKKSAELIYAGRVGTGFNAKRLEEIHKKLIKLKRTDPPVSSTLTKLQTRGAHWVEPKLVCEVEFAEWTDDGNLRQAAFIALRDDKPAKDIIREQPISLNNTEAQAHGGKSSKKSEPAQTAKSTRASAPQKKSMPKSKKGSLEIADIKISSADRIIDTESGKTKFDLVQFYESISDFILPHLKDRAVSLMRAPDGIEGEQFFQKHSDNRGIPSVTQLDPALDPDHDPLMMIEDVHALVGCVQMNTIEFHTWGSTIENIEAPDRFVLDLDPDPALPWRSVLEAARLTLAVLDELKLDAFLKTTGGKGIHVIVPLTPDADWTTVKAFSKAIVNLMAKQIPSRFVAKMGPKNRIGKIFIDYLRNSRGASTVCAYSVRARPGLPVSVPIAREELDNISQPNYWHIGNLHERLDKLKRNPWGTYSGERYRKNQKITTAMWKKLGAKAPV